MKASTFRSEFMVYKDSMQHLSEQQIDLLESLASKVQEWNEKVNLISRKDVEFIVPNHIMPSLAISLVKRFDEHDTVIDVGTGGGFPGLPMAIACPNTAFTLLDSNAKKMKIVEEIATSLGLKNVEVVTSRAEAFTDRKYKFIMGRAVSNLPNFLSFSSHFLDADAGGSPMNGDMSSKTGGLLYLKGGDFGDELDMAGIEQHSLHPVKDLVQGLDTDKNVLYIPAADVLRFHADMLRRNEALAIEREMRKKMAKEKKR